MQTEPLLIIKLLISGLAVAVFAVWELRLPNAVKPILLQDSRNKQLDRYLRNIGLWSINVLLTPLLTLPFSLFMASHALQWRGEYSALLLDILLLDLWIYWWHRANHRFSLLWRFHQVHHLDQWLDVTTAFRFHFGEVFISAVVRGLFIWLMGIGWESLLVFELLVLVCATFHHSNIRLPAALEKRLSRVLITPSIHWVHHHAQRVNTDSNYGTVLTLWDTLFGSRSKTTRTPEMRLGVESVADMDLAGLLVLPVKNS